VVRIFAILVYYVIGCLYYGYSPTCQWAPFKVFYFICVSITTCGYGDVVPISDSDKLFTVIYVTFGIAVVFAAISDAALYFFQQLEEKAEEKRKLIEKERALSQGHSEIEIPDNDDDIYRHETMRVLFYVSTIASMIIVGGGIVSIVEDKSFISGIYWAFQTTTTVGYGDESQENSQARIIASLYLLLSCGVVGSAIANIAGAKEDTKRELKQRNLLRKKLDLDMIQALDKDGNGVDRAEFVVGMLMAMDLVDEEVTTQLLYRFDQLDVDGSGTLDKDDLIRAASMKFDRSPSSTSPMSPKSRSNSQPDDSSNPLISSSSTSPPTSTKKTPSRRATVNL
jgi:voltage-gated potassium channel Kch